MKAMILAAGKGERMRPLTQTTPKPLLMINGDPLLVHHLRRLAAAGIKDVVINVWYLGQQIIETIGNGNQYGVRVEYSVEEELLDTGGGIVRALPKLGVDPFLVISADIYTDFNFNTLPLQPNGLAHLVMVPNPNYHPKGDFGLQNGKILMPTKDNFTYANIGVFRPEFFSNCPPGIFPLRDLLYKHIINNLVTGQYYTDMWQNIGTPADLELANLTCA